MDHNLIALAANVRIAGDKKIIGYIQKVEYMIANECKESEKPLNLEYIIGGIASTYRKKHLLAVGGYSSDSITEDIDLSLKLLNIFGNKTEYIDYADDVLAFTPPAHNLKDLQKQRIRWKYGRFKALVKNKKMFFSLNREKYTLALTWWKLPKIVFLKNY